MSNVSRYGLALALALFGALTAASCNDPSLARTDAAADAPAAEASAPTDGGAPADAAPAPIPERPTYWRDVAPITAARCAECHEEGGIGPFRLDRYDEARDRAVLIARETREGRMPPWPPGDGCRPLQHERRLSERELTILDRWARTGATEGNRNDFVAPVRTVAPFPATVDQVLQGAAPYTPPMEALDDYRCIVIDPGWTEAKHLVQARIVPGDTRIVHHLNLFEVRAASVPTLERLDQRDAGEGYRCFGGVGVATGTLADQRVQYVAGWAPGSPYLHTPPNTGIRLEPGSRLVMQLHYNQSVVRGASDRTRVEMVYAATPPRRQALVLPLIANDFRIPAGAPDHAVEATMVPRSLGVTFPVTIYGSFPHMHQFGRAVRSEVRHANGTTDCLVDIPRWQFHWQGFYDFVEPLRVEPDDQVRLQCRYDNSAANQPVVDGVQRPPQEVREGNNTLDEMCMNFYYLTIL